MLQSFTLETNLYFRFYWFREAGVNEEWFSSVEAQGAALFAKWTLCFLNVLYQTGPTGILNSKS